MFIFLLFLIPPASKLPVWLENVQDASSLCRVFSIDKLSPSHEKQQKMAAASAVDITGGTHIHSAELSSAIVKNERSQGSTSKPQVFSLNIMVFIS